MLKKIRTILLASIIASSLAVSASAQKATESATKDFSYWGKTGSSNWLLIALGAFAVIIVIGLVYRSLRRPKSGSW